jgi:hypothetical protein
MGGLRNVLHCDKEELVKGLSGEPGPSSGSHSMAPEMVRAACIVQRHERLSASSFNSDCIVQLFLGMHVSGWYFKICCRLEWGC